MGNVIINKSDNYETINVLLDEHKHPVAFKNAVSNLVSCGVSEKNAKEYIRITEIELEIYYNPKQGLFGIESEVVESSETFNPYDGKPLINGVVKVSNIDYDCDELDDVDGLPKELEINIPHHIDEEEVYDYVSDEISNITGYCHKGFIIS